MFKRAYLYSSLLRNIISNKLWRTVHIENFETFFKLEVNSCEYIFTKSFVNKTKLFAGKQYEIYSNDQLLATCHVTETMTFYPGDVLNIIWLTDWSATLTTYFRHFERA